eukprot:29905-Pelagococcus_subviridis.AAC.4
MGTSVRRTHLVLRRRLGDLHPARAADRGVRDVAVAADLVARVDDDHALAELVAQHARHLSDHRRLPHPGPPEKQTRFARAEQVLYHVDVAVHRASDPAGQPDDLPGAVAYARYPVQRPLDPGAVVAAEIADARLRLAQILRRHGRRAKALVRDGVADEARDGTPPEVEDHLDEARAVRVAHQHLAHVRREHLTNARREGGDGRGERTVSGGAAGRIDRLIVERRKGI